MYQGGTWKNDRKYVHTHPEKYVHERKEEKNHLHDSGLV